MVTGLTLPNARPPDEVKPAFDEVNGAQQVRERLINEAQAYAAKVVPEARGRAASTRTVAEGYKEALIAKAQGDAERFALLQAQYAGALEVTRKRLWLETMQQVLSQNRKVIGGDGRQLIYVPMAEAGTRPGPAQLPTMSLPSVLSQDSDTGSTSSSAESIRNPDRTARPTGREGSER